MRLAARAIASFIDYRSVEDTESCCRRSITSSASVAFIDYRSVEDTERYQRDAISVHQRQPSLIIDPLRILKV